MKILYFPGCKIPDHNPQYDLATRAVLDRLGVSLLAPRLTCCGYPVRHLSFEAGVYSAARIIGLARRLDAMILTPCKCCYGSLRHAHHWLQENPALRRDTQLLLAERELEWSPDVKIRHLLSVLYENIGRDRLRRSIVKPLTNLRVAAHYGCHALRPANVVQFDDPLAPTLFEELIAATGATPVDWPLRLECCGAPLWGKNRHVSLQLMQRKLDDAARCGAELVCTACTYCHIQFDTIRSRELPEPPERGWPPAILYPQLLGLAMGISERALGLDKNCVSPEPLAPLRS